MGNEAFGQQQISAWRRGGEILWNPVSTAERERERERNGTFYKLYLRANKLFGKRTKLYSLI